MREQFRSLLSLLFLAGAGAQSVLAQSGIEQLEEMWKRGDYAAVLPKLIDYRERTGTKTPQIDYMIASSACRIPVHKQSGNQFFSWILYNYNLSAENRATVESERQRCSSDTPPQRLQMAVPATLVGVSYIGKGGTAIRATSSGNGTAAVVVPIPIETFARRLFPPESADAAAAEVKRNLGAGTQVEHVGHFFLVRPPRSRETSSGSPDGIAQTLYKCRPNLLFFFFFEQNALNARRAPLNAAARAPAITIPNAAAAAVTAPSSPGGDSRRIPNSNPDQGSLMVQQRPLPSGLGAQQSMSTSPDVSSLKNAGLDLERYLEFFASEYGMQRPANLVTVYFTESVGELESLARKLHGIELAPGTIGYSFPLDQSMAGWANGTAYGTFVHELFHMMVRYNFGDIPPWLDEGMAALYEVSRFEGTRAAGVDNWRGEILRDSWAARPSLRALAQMNRSEFDVQVPTKGLMAGTAQAVNHATARYFMQYLQSRGSLNAVYRAFLPKSRG